MNKWQSYQAQTTKQLLPNYAWNASENWATIASRAETSAICVTDLPKGSGPALVLGSGPSLDQIAPILSSFRGAVFASPSQLDILERWAAAPTHIVAGDSADKVAEQLSGRHWYDSVLLTHPAVSPKVLDTWKGVLAMFRVNTHSEWGAMQAFVYPWIKAELDTGGCTPTIAMGLASFLGYSPIIFAGLDLGFPNRRYRAQGWTKRGEHLFAQDTVQFVEEGITTTDEMRYYRLMLLAIWKTRKYRIYQVDPPEGALLREFRHVSIQDLMRQVFPPYFKPERIDQIVDMVLEPEGIRVKLDKDGGATLEWFDPEPPEAEPKVPETVHAETGAVDVVRARDKEKGQRRTKKR